MTEKKQDQAKAKQQNQAIELEDAQLEKAQGGSYERDARVGGTGGGTTGIRDGMSN